MRATSSMAATGAPGVEAVTANPSGATEIESKWLIHTCWVVGWPPRNTTAPGAVTVISVRPYSPEPVLATMPPGSCWAISWAP